MSRTFTPNFIVVESTHTVCALHHPLAEMSSARPLSSSPRRFRRWSIKALACFQQHIDTFHIQLFGLLLPFLESFFPHQPARLTAASTRDDILSCIMQFIALNTELCLSFHRPHDLTAAGHFPSATQHHITCRSSVFIQQSIFLPSPGFSASISTKCRTSQRLRDRYHRV